mmetsp:Transcript_9439/g.21576  ORF Transcript_9439/g.21576 Transcript_9439/m.21576 type:complete len:351 (+) Transcript_9439:11-1063(+)
MNLSNPKRIREEFHEFSGKIVAISGAGCIGLELAKRFLSYGSKLRVLDIAEPGLIQVRKAGGATVRGDVTNSEYAAKLVAGAQVVIHTAAIIKDHGDLDQIRRVNVGGAQTLAEAAVEAHAQTFVLFSSVLVYGFDYPSQVPETGPLRGESNALCQTMIEAEEAVLSVTRHSSTRVIILRPGDVYSAASVPWVLRPLQLRKALAGSRFVVPTRWGRFGVCNHVYVDNLVDAAVLVLKKQNSVATDREAFNVTDGAETTWGEYFKLLDVATGGTGLIWAVPGLLLQAFFVFFGLVIRWMVDGKTEPPTKETIKFWTRPHTVSTAKIKRLGFVPRVGLAEGMERTRLDLKLT